MERKRRKRKVRRKPRGLKIEVGTGEYWGFRGIKEWERERMIRGGRERERRGRTERERRGRTDMERR